LHGFLHYQLGGTFWLAGHSYNGQGCPVHLCCVDRCLHQPGQWASTTCSPRLTTLRAIGCTGRSRTHLCASGTGSTCHSHLPWVLMGLCAAPKEDSAVFSGKLINGSPLILPGQLLHVTDPPRGDVPPPPTRPASYAAVPDNFREHSANPL